LTAVKATLRSLPLPPRRVAAALVLLATWCLLAAPILEDWREEDWREVDWREETLDVREEATEREEVTAVRAFGLLLSLVLVAAASGAVHNSAAEANKTVVLILISDRIKQTPLRRWKQTLWRIRTRPGGKNSKSQRYKDIRSKSRTLPDFGKS
jgi:hypothetical protein